MNRITGYLILFFIFHAIFCKDVTMNKKPPSRPDQDSRSQNKTEKIMKTQQGKLFEIARTGKGEQYESAEAQLIAKANDPVTKKVLDYGLHHPDPIAQLLAKYILNWNKEKQDLIDSAQTYLNELPDKIKDTPVSQPPPSGVAHTLQENYHGKLTDYFAIRLIKQDDWAYWRITSIIIYLEEQKEPSSTAGLIRFVAKTDDPELREMVYEAIKNLQDPAIKDKIQEEVDFQENSSIEMRGRLDTLKILHK